MLFAAGVVTPLVRDRQGIIPQLRLAIGEKSLAKFCRLSHRPSSMTPLCDPFTVEMPIPTVDTRLGLGLVDGGLMNIRKHFGRAWAMAGLFMLVASHQFARAAGDAKPPKTIVFLGDSLTAGLGLDVAEAYPSLIQSNLDSLGLPFEVVNAGVSGDTTAGGLRRIDWLLRRKIDVLVIALGGNDGLRGISPDVTRANLQGIIDKARRRFPAVRIVVAGMQMPPNLGEDYTREFRRVFSEIAKANQTAFIPFLLERVGGIPRLNQPDRIHPTTEGQKMVADNVWKVLLPLLKDNSKEKQ